jgi:hypothetical protein
MQPAVFSVFSVSDMTLLKTNKSNDTRKKRRNHVKQACLPCRRAHTACDETKPCARCVKQCRPELCVQTEEEYKELANDEGEARPLKRQKREESPERPFPLESSPPSQLPGHPLPSLLPQPQATLQHPSFPNTIPTQSQPFPPQIPSQRSIPTSLPLAHKPSSPPSTPHPNPSHHLHQRHS